MSQSLSRRHVAAAVITLIVASVLIVGALWGQGAAPPQGMLDGVRDAYRNASSGWRARLLPIAQSTFLILAGIEFAVSGMIWSLRRDSLDEIAAKFLLKFTLIAFLLAVLTAFTAWLPPIMNGFAAAGERAIGRGLVSPSTVVDIGRETGAKVLEQLNLGVMLRDPVMAMVAALASMIIALSYVWIAAQLVLVMVESYIVVLGGGVLFFGFASSRWTASFAENVVGYAFYVGAKMFLLYLIVGVGADVARSWIPLIQGSDFFGRASPMMEVLGGAVMFAVVATVVPTRVAGRLTHNQSFGIAHALRALS
ncbi:MAG: P-type conjugative transfer protein TrbL [bacterium]